MNKRLCPNGRLDVFYFCEEGLFGLVENSGMVRNFSFGFLGEIRNLDLCLLLYFHEIFFDFLYFGLIFGDFFI